MKHFFPGIVSYFPKYIYLSTYIHLYVHLYISIYYVYICVLYFFILTSCCNIIYRWIQWIRASERFDLEVMGPEYAHRNYRLCHLHFEEKWYKIGKNRAQLHPDAIPTIFFGKK